MINILKYQRVNLSKLTFIDLFAGIGGFRYALESFGCKCVFTSEWDKSCQQVYVENFNEQPAGDITQIPEDKIPSHDILAAGFPCQAFSISGKRKGFEDTRGTLFFDIVRIAKFHRPKILLLENVKNLLTHDNGTTFQVIEDTLRSINYDFFYKLIKASDFGLPQGRQRVYMVCFRKEMGIRNFKFPENYSKLTKLSDILENEDDVPNYCYINRSDIVFNVDKINKTQLFDIPYNRPWQIGYLNNGGQGERIYDPKGHSVTLASTTGGPGGSTGLYLINDRVRKLTPRECARLQGFPETHKIHPSVKRAYYHFGNSVPINVLQNILMEINNTIPLKK
jgi:DNA (cytosine-5)-methyltransferase 1